MAEPDIGHRLCSNSSVETDRRMIFRIHTKAPFTEDLQGSSLTDPSTPRLPLSLFLCLFLEMSNVHGCFICVCVPLMCLLPSEARKGCWIPRNYSLQTPPCRCWGSSLGPLEEQAELLTTELLQDAASLFPASPPRNNHSETFN